METIEQMVENMSFEDLQSVVTDAIEASFYEELEQRSLARRILYVDPLPSEGDLSWTYDVGEEDAKYVFIHHKKMDYAREDTLVHSKIRGETNCANIPDCSIHRENIICCKRSDFEINNIKAAFRTGINLNAAVNWFVKEELIYARRLLDHACNRYSSNVIRLTRGTVKTIDDVMDGVMKSLDKYGGLGNVLINKGTLDSLRRRHLLRHDFLTFMLEANEGSVLTHPSVPRNTVYAMVPDRDLGPMPEKGIHTYNMTSKNRVCWSIVDHVGFMIVSPRGIRKITWR